MTLGERIKFIRGTQAREMFAPIMEVSKNTLIAYEKDERVPGADFLYKILELHPEMSPEWLLTGRGNFLSGAAPVAAEEYVRYADAQELQKEYVLVPRYDVRVSAGGGSLVENEQVVDHLAFKASWVNAMHLNAANLLLVNTLGDSMYPTIKEGDLLLVDKGQRDVKDDAIYILLFDGALVAKRLQKLYDGSIQIKSDNKVYDTQLVPYDRVKMLNIIGRVVWGGGRM